MWKYRFLYILKSTRQNIMDHAPSLAMSVTAVGFTLLLFAFYVLLLSNLQTMGKRMGEDLQVTLYLEKKVSAKDRSRIVDALAGMKEVESVAYRSPEKALESLSLALGETSGVLTALSANPLPASFEVRLDPAFRDLASIRDLSDGLGKVPGVSDVEYGGEWIERFFGFVKILKWLGASLGVLLLAATMIVISSTLSLGFYARKDEIEILRLVGASESYIKLPFFWEAMLQGMGGAVAALGILWLIFLIFHMKVMGAWSLFAGWVEFHFLSPTAVLGIVFLGAFVGGLSCIVSFSRFTPRP